MDLVCAIWSFNIARISSEIYPRRVLFSAGIDKRLGYRNIHVCIYSLAGTNMAELIKNNLRRWRFERDEMTQEDLAQRAGVTRQTIIALEKDRYSPSLILAFRLAHALQVEMEDLFQYYPADSGN